MLTRGYELDGPRLVVRVHGTPAPQGSKKAMPIYRGRGANREFTGRINQVEMSKRLGPWRTEVVKATRIELRACRDMTWPLVGPLAADITFTMPKPVNAPKRRRTWPAVTPDLDKLTRGLLDALKIAGAIVDDSRFIELTVRKAYPGEHQYALDRPGAHIVLFEVVESAVLT